MQPMTALIEEDDGGPLWIFTSKESDLARAIGGGKPAHATFTGKKHDLFANVIGRLSIDNDRAVIERLWNPLGRGLVRGRQGRSRSCACCASTRSTRKIWLNATPLGAAIEWLLRRDPKESYKDKVAEVGALGRVSVPAGGRRRPSVCRPARTAAAGATSTEALREPPAG